MPFQMFQMEIGLVAMRAFVFAFSVLIWIRRRFARSWSWATRVCWQHATAALLADNMYRLWL
jgi:hypothetical protein